MTWNLHTGDCLDTATGLASIPDQGVDHVITDPPYEAEAHTKQRRQKTTRAGEYVRKAQRDPLPFEPITAVQRAAVAREIGRVCRGWALVFCQVEAVAAWRDVLELGGMRYRRTIAWVKPDAMPALHGRWPGQGFETIVLAQSKRAGSPPCPGGGKAVWYAHTRAQPGSPGGPGSGKAPHPTTKPLPLMRDLVDLVSHPGELICDPFAGSGTTGVASLALGRRFVGWELDEGFAEVARRRLAGEEAQPNPHQASLFAEARS